MIVKITLEMFRKRSQTTVNSNVEMLIRTAWMMCHKQGKLSNVSDTELKYWVAAS